ncbi:hypothetical protein H2203_002868 [Taxawa tesnikishii (nom. ined.)]|nr:hypothetical protein H2203_002868 [Dothideales sp. JES 119]
MAAMSRFGSKSAGYFNTVGSKEGWTPSTFVSSRTNRHKDDQKTTQQRAKAFMDEEDLADAAEAQKLETQGSFAGLGSTQEGGMPRGFLTDLFKTSGETMGVKLLQRMDWRQGQGIGAKVRRRARLEGSGKAVPADQESHLFAPDDSQMVSLVKKTDRFGLGYSGEERLESAVVRGSRAVQDEDEDEGSSNIFSLSRASSTKPKAKAKRTGFGVGILNDTGSDEEDPYEMGPKIAYNRIIGFKKSAPTFSTTNRALQRSSAISGFRKCYDGRLPLDGFILSTTLLADQESKYPPPKIPAGWRSSKQGLSASAPGTSSPSNFQSTADAAKASTLDPAARAALLGEEQLKGKSVFDYLTSAARDRLAAATGNQNLPAARGEAAPAGYQQTEQEKARSLWDLVPRLDKDTAAAALSRGTSGWMPYAEDENKRARYRAFLEIMSGLRNGLPERAKGMANAEWETEMREFVQAALVFKPVTGLMASRFTSSSSAPKLANDAPDKPAVEEARKDPAEEAARLGMFGPMTRSRVQFYPTRLTCKRFGVKPPAHVLVDPGPGAGDEGSAAKDSRLGIVNQAKLDQMMREMSWNRPTAAAAAGVQGDGGVGIEAEIALAGTGRTQPAEVDVERNDALEGQRAGEAVFKAIFGSDDEDE